MSHMQGAFTFLPLDHVLVGAGSVANPAREVTC